MVDPAIVEIVRQYLAVLPEYGVHGKRAVLFGSSARGDIRNESDIDLLVIAPEFDERRDMEFIQQLWRARLRADYRLEPIPCGEREWESGTSDRAIVDIARSEGQLIETE
ncbi:MAG: nucleotidyltransferase domain-containing protein [Candidatus Hydrogenedentota bacterium]